MTSHQRPGQGPLLSIGVVTEHLERFLLSFPPETCRAYFQDLIAVADWQRAFTLPGGMTALLQGGCLFVSDLLERFVVEHLQNCTLAPVVRRRLAALRSWLRYAYDAGLISWRVSAPRVRSMALPPIDHLSPTDVAHLVQAASGDGPVRQARDVAVIQLLYAVGLRPGELVRLNVADLDERHQRVRLHDASQAYRDIDLPDTVWTAVACWLRYRSHHPGPLIIRILPQGSFHWSRMSTRSVRQMVTTWARSAGISANPRRLRQSGIITAASAPHPARQLLHTARLASLPGRTIAGPLPDAGRITADLASLSGNRES